MATPFNHTSVDNVSHQNSDLKVGCRTDNVIALLGAAAAAAPQVAAQGNDTNVDLQLVTKGSGNVVVPAGHLVSGSIGGALSKDEFSKLVTGLLDTVATDVLTITVPNAAHAAVIRVTALARLGAGGAIGVGEAAASEYIRCTIVRTPGVAAVGQLLPLEMSGTNPVTNVNQLKFNVGGGVAGAATVTVTLALSAVAGAVGAVNTFTITAAVTKSGGASDNHTVALWVEVLNAAAAGITVA